MDWSHPSVDGLVLHDFVHENPSLFFIGDDDSFDVLLDASVDVAGSDASFGFDVDPVDGICSTQLAEPGIAVVEDESLVLDWIELVDVVGGRNHEEFALLEMCFGPARLADAGFAPDHLQPGTASHQFWRETLSKPRLLRGTSFVSPFYYLTNFDKKNNNNEFRLLFRLLFRSIFGGKIQLTTVLSHSVIS